MLPASNQGLGMNMGMPDVCLTPAAPAPIPIPYPNLGMNAMSMPFCPTILVSMAPAQNMASKPLMTNGDNAGVAHPLCMQPGGLTMGNPRILMTGMPASHLGCPSYGNNFNNPVGAKTVPSVTNVFLGDVRAGEAGALRELWGAEPLGLGVAVDETGLVLHARRGRAWSPCWFAARGSGVGRSLVAPRKCACRSRVGTEREQTITRCHEPRSPLPAGP